MNATNSPKGHVVVIPPASVNHHPVAPFLPLVSLPSLHVPRSFVSEAELATAKLAAEVTKARMEKMRAKFKRDIMVAHARAPDAGNEVRS